MQTLGGMNLLTGLFQLGGSPSAAARDREPQPANPRGFASTLAHPCFKNVTRI
jgi:hypothetical protein